MIKIPPWPAQLTEAVPSRCSETECGNDDMQVSSETEEHECYKEDTENEGKNDFAGETEGGYDSERQTNSEREVENHTVTVTRWYRRWLRPFLGPRASGSVDQPLSLATANGVPFDDSVKQEETCRLWQSGAEKGTSK